MSTESTEDSVYITEKFVGHNSLKAWKIEHDKQQAENPKNKAAKPKSPKGNKSPNPKGAKEGAKSPSTDATKKGKDSRPKSGSPKSSASPTNKSPRSSAKGKVIRKLNRYSLNSISFIVKLLEPIKFRAFL